MDVDLLKFKLEKSKGNNFKDDALLGNDILMDKDSKAEILLGRNIIKCYGHEIPCLSANDKEERFNLRSADQYLIPPISEMLIQAFVHMMMILKKLKKCFFFTLH